MEINKNNWITNLFTEELIKLFKKNKKIILYRCRLEGDVPISFCSPKKALQ
jgi:hypothetical protein